MNLQGRYDELDNIETSLRILIKEIKDEDYKEELQEIMLEAQNEKEEIQPRLLEEREAEERALEIEYKRSVV